MNESSLSRRSFLTGVVTTAAATTLPAFAAPMENPCNTVFIDIDSDVPWALIPDENAYHRPRYFLTASQWDRWQAHMGKYFMERCCARIETMPGELIHHTERMARGVRQSATYTWEINDERQTQRLPMSRNHQKRQYGPRPPVEAHIRSFRREA